MPKTVWTPIVRAPRRTTLGSLLRTPKAGIVARTTDGDHYKLVKRISKPDLKNHGSTIWTVEWVTTNGLPLRSSFKGERTGRVELKGLAPHGRTMDTYAYRMAA
jgi:hypothetical protein